ncbi:MULTISPECIES: transposase [unclassified Streptomyces]|uniref:transposase n=1 Tax=unclassified Streptomyces TaxID=2593676 RepID=UPI000A7EE565|nr:MULTISPECIES: transposase [unclassified Streptomyces]
MAEPVRVRRLTDQEGWKLQRIVRRGSTNSVRCRRAMMLLASAGGNRVPVIAQLVQADEDTVRDVIHRFNEIGLACLRKVHGRVIQTGGREALRCLLARRRVAFQHTKTWKESPDPEREAKLDRIEEVLDRFPDRGFAFDEFGPLGIRPAPGLGWAAQKRPDRLPATYHRTHGVRYFHGCYSVGDGTLWGINRRKKGAVNTPAALKSIRAARPDGAPIYVIMDNPSAHKGAGIRRWATKNKVELCFTPTHTSWANPIEAHFGPLRQFTIANSHHPNHTVQTRALHAYLRRRNANARHRDVLAAERKERARIRSEKGICWGGRLLKTAA